jgi:hypothetical protein
MTVPSTMLDLARYPDAALRAPLNKKKQEPVTETKHNTTYHHLTCKVTKKKKRPFTVNCVYFLANFACVNICMNITRFNN